jgi:hypothetical protein
MSLSRRDVSLARRISAVARARGIPADPTAVQLINITIDALVRSDVLPFWRALLGYRQIGDDYLADPARRGPGFGIQSMDTERRNAIGCTWTSPSRTIRRSLFLAVIRRFVRLVLNCRDPLATECHGRLARLGSDFTASDLG